jgi:hypothetical protein
MVLAVWAGAVLAQAQNTSNYIFLVGAGFLCDSTDSPACPAAAKAPQGESYEFSGAGSFDVEDKKVKGAGTYTHRLSNGRVAETGVWTAEELVSFLSYGTAPGAFLRERHASEKMPPDPRQAKVRMLSEPMPTGGLAVFRIQLLSISGAARNAVLQVNCALPDVPHERSVEAIQLAFERNGENFSEPAGGRVIFLSLRPEVNVPARAPQQKEASGTSEPPQS